jgi:hypothetical protein
MTQITATEVADNAQLSKNLIRAITLVFIEHRDNWIREFMQLRKQYKETFGL